MFDLHFVLQKKTNLSLIKTKVFISSFHTIFKIGKSTNVDIRIGQSPIFSTIVDIT